MFNRLTILWFGVFLLDLTLALRQPHAHLQPFALLTKSKRSLDDSTTTPTPITTPYDNTWDSDSSYPDSDHTVDSDDSGFGRPTPPPRRPPPIFCRACIHHTGREYPAIFQSKETLHNHMVKNHEVDANHINDPPGRHSLPYRCLECGAKCRTLTQYFDHYYYWHRADPDPPRAPTMKRYRYQCPYCWGKIGFDLTLDEYKRHHMYYHQGRRLVEFPKMLMNQGDYSRVFSGKRMAFLPIINSNRIADNLANRASQQLLNNNVERHVQCPPAEEVLITPWPSLNLSNFQRMGTSTPDNNRPDPNANHPEQQQPDSSVVDVSLSPPGPSEIRVRPPVSKASAKGQSIQNSGKGKSGKSVYDPNKASKDDLE